MKKKSPFNSNYIFAHFCAFHFKYIHCKRMPDLILNIYSVTHTEWNDNIFLKEQTSARCKKRKMFTYEKMSVDPILYAIFG